MKIRKSYRFSPFVVDHLDRLCKLYPDLTETDIIESAIITASFEAHFPAQGSGGSGPQVQRQGDPEFFYE